MTSVAQLVRAWHRASHSPHPSLIPRLSPQKRGGRRESLVTSAGKLVDFRRLALVPAGFLQLLFEVGIYFIGKPTDINDSWIRYVQVEGNRSWRYRVINIHIFISGSFLHQEGVIEALEGGKSVLSNKWFSTSLILLIYFCLTVWSTHINAYESVHDPKIC